jgi:hypothetical protein
VNVFDIDLNFLKKYLVEIAGDAADEAVTNEYILIRYVIKKNGFFFKKITDINHFSLSIWRVVLDS